MPSSRRLTIAEKRAIVQDAIHGSIMITNAEYITLQTPFMRRLHGIKQLGFSYLVFPSATHSRLSHSIGVMHIASKMADSLLSRLEPKECREILGKCGESEKTAFRTLARMAGLIHDVGHYPYSHMFENAVEHLMKRGDIEWEASPAGYGRLKPHEEAGYIFAREMARIAGEDLGEEELALVISAAAKTVFARSPEKEYQELGLAGHAWHIVRDIISHDVVDADRLDYLRRDAWFTGVVYGYTDLERVYEGINIGLAGRPKIVYDRKSYQSIEDVFDSRYKMYRSVYYHHKVMSLSYSMKRLISYVREEWSSIAPERFEGVGFDDLIQPERLAKMVAEGELYFDDTDFDDIIRNILARGSREARRWARCFTHERHLLPISLVKRQDEIVGAIEEVLGSGGSVHERLSNVSRAMSMFIDSNILLSEFGERIRREASVLAGVSYSDVEFDAEVAFTSGSEGGFDTIYIRILDELSSIPIVVPFIYSEDPEAHEKLYRRRREIRKAFRDIVSRSRVWSAIR